MTSSILRIAQWSAENQTYALAAWVVLAGLLYLGWTWAAHIYDQWKRTESIRAAMGAREARERWVR